MLSSGTSVASVRRHTLGSLRAFPTHGGPGYKPADWLLRCPQLLPAPDKPRNAAGHGALFLHTNFSCGASSNAKGPFIHIPLRRTADDRDAIVMSAVVYEEVALAEMTYEDSEQMYYYECPCGDKFEISLEDLYDGEDIAPCPSCTLQIKVLFKEVSVFRACGSLTSVRYVACRGMRHVDMAKPSSTNTYFPIPPQCRRGAGSSTHDPHLFIVAVNPLGVRVYSPPATHVR